MFSNNWKNIEFNEYSTAIEDYFSKYTLLFLNCVYFEELSFDIWSRGKVICNGGFKMKKEKNDILYSVNVELSKEKYKAMTKFISFSKSLFVIMLFRMSIILMYFVFLYFNDSQKRIYEPIIIFITLSIIVYIVSKKTRKYAEKEYNWLVKKGKIDVEYELIFYKNYLKKEGYISPVKVKYSDLINIVETDDMFYLFVEKDNSIIIDKKNCDEELI